MALLLTAAPSCTGSSRELSGAPAAAPVRPQAPPSHERVAAQGLPNRAWDTVVSERFGFRVPLPDRARWAEVSDERWFALGHPPTQSSLRMRTWRASPRVTKDECREQVYLWRGELRPIADPVVDGRLEAPEGFDVGVRIDLFDEPNAGRRAVVLAVGATVRRCYAAVFETAFDPGVDEAELGARLRLITQAVLDQVEIIGVEAIAVPPPPF